MRSPDSSPAPADSRREAPDPQTGAPHTVLVVPCYNEESDLVPTTFEAFAREDGSRILFVDDGSSDATPVLLAGLGARNPGRIDVLTMPRNAGKAGAVRAGMLRAFEMGPRFAGYWDADLATPLVEVPRFRAILEDDPDLLLVMGSRVKLLGRDVERKVLRHYGGRVFATFASLALGLPVYDTQCGAKLFRNTDETRGVFAAPFETGWVFDVEILARLVSRHGDAVRGMVLECPLQSWRDVGESSVRSTDFFRSLMALARIRRLYGRARG